MVSATEIRIKRGVTDRQDADERLHPIPRPGAHNVCRLQHDICVFGTGKLQLPEHQLDPREGVFRIQLPRLCMYLTYNLRVTLLTWTGRCGDDISDSWPALNAPLRLLDQYPPDHEPSGFDVEFLN